MIHEYAWKLNKSDFVFCFIDVIVMLQLPWCVDNIKDEVTIVQINK